MSDAESWVRIEARIEDVTSALAGLAEFRNAPMEFFEAYKSLREAGAPPEDLDGRRSSASVLFCRLAALVAGGTRCGRLPTVARSE